MSENLTVSVEEILYQLKLSGQLTTILEGIAARHVIVTTATAAGITVEDKELQEAADTFRLTNNLQQAEGTWLWLQKHGLSLDEFEAMIEGTVLSTKLAHHLFADRVEPYFVEHTLDYLQVVMYEMILDDKDLAWELFYALQEGEANFHALAHQYNSDEQLRRTGGYRGLLRRQDLNPEISAVVFAAKPPQMLKPIVTAKGVHLILVEEIVRSHLDESLRKQILSDLFALWLKQQVEQVKLTMVDKKVSAVA